MVKDDRFSTWGTRCEPVKLITMSLISHLQCTRCGTRYAATGMGAVVAMPDNTPMPILRRVTALALGRRGQQT
jgi:hypothetical protein